MSKKEGTKLCKHCKTEIPVGAKVCPQCRKKQGGILKWVGIVFVVLIIIGLANGGGDEKDTKTDNNALKSSNTETEVETTKIEYISVTAKELSDALSNNAMKAQNDYKDHYLEISGKLGNIDSNGKYIDIDSDELFDFTIIQCYLKTDEQKEIIMNMSKGNPIVVKGYCKDVGELMGYSINIESIE